MKKEILSFKEEGHRITNNYSIHPDRIEREWQTLTRKGKNSYPRDQATGEYSEMTTFGYGAKSILITGGFYFLTGMILHLGFDNGILNVIGYLLYGMSIVAGLFLLVRMKKETWIYFKKPDGTTLFCVRKEGLREVTVERIASCLRESPNTANKS